MKSTSNLIKVIARELGEINAFIRPFSYQILALIVIAAIVGGIGMILVIPITAHPAGLAGFIAGVLAGWCAQGSPCQFEQIYPAFASFSVVLAMTTTMLVIILHMYVNRYQVKTDELHTLLCAVTASLDEIRAHFGIDEELDRITFLDRAEKAGCQNAVAEGQN